MWRITWNSSLMPLPPCMSRAVRAMSSALPALLRLIRLMASGASLSSSINRPARRQACRPKGDLGHHVGELLLVQLGLGQGPAELDAVEAVLSRGVPAELGRAHGAPGDAEAGLVQAAEGAAEARGVGQEVGFRDEDLVHHQLAGDRGLHGELALDLGRREAGAAGLDDEAADASVELGPDHGEVRDGAVGDPGLGAADLVAAVDGDGARLHAAGVGAVVGLSQAEAADQFAAGQARQILLALVFRAVGDRSDA
jgi:hypothetical protein